MMGTWNVRNYIKTVKAIALDAIGEHPNDDDARREYVSESVDGNEYIIYYGANQTVLDATDNEPDGAEIRAMSANDAEWRTMRTLAAYMAMETDVLAEIDRLIAHKDEIWPPIWGVVGDNA
jgi:hypothetical protein